MFDYYGLKTDWPGRDSQEAATVENAMADDLSKAMGNSFDRRRFMPYVQMHEFEALLFSAPDILGKVFAEQDVTRMLQSIADDFCTPEEIDNRPDEAPSKRILQLSPGYQKVLHGNIAARRIGLEIMRRKCPHFADWLTRLESLGQSP